jgi:putative hemolysin
MIGVGIALVLLFGLLTLVSYVDRLYQELGKFLSREFQDNIDAFEQIVEPHLGMTRGRASVSMAILTQLVTAAIAMIVGFAVFRDRAWSINEVLEATLSLILIIIICNRLLPFVFFFTNPGTLAPALDPPIAPPHLPGPAGDPGARILPIRCRPHPRTRRPDA